MDRRHNGTTPGQDHVLDVGDRQSIMEEIASPYGEPFISPGRRSALVMPIDDPMVAGLMKSSPCKDEAISSMTSSWRSPTSSA